MIRDHALLFVVVSSGKMRRGLPFLTATSPTAATAAVTTATAVAAVVVCFRFWRRAVKAERTLIQCKESAAALPPMPLLPITSTETLRCCANLELRDTDVFICSYPKSGTTWMQNIVVNLLTHGESPAEGEHISAFAPFFEVDRTWNHRTGELSGIYAKASSNNKNLSEEPTREEVGFKDGRRVFNTHLRWDQMPRSNSSGARYIYVVRDGKDVVTSFFHHLSNQADSGGFDGTFEDFFSVSGVEIENEDAYVKRARSE